MPDLRIFVEKSARFLSSEDCNFDEDSRLFEQHYLRFCEVTVVYAIILFGSHTLQLFSASLSSSPTTSQCKTSACRLCHKISPPTVPQQFSDFYSYKLSHSPVLWNCHQPLLIHVSSRWRGSLTLETLATCCAILNSQLSVALYSSSEFEFLFRCCHQKIGAEDHKNAHFARTFE